MTDTTNKPIAVGDLVQVVRSCCDDRIGIVFRVPLIRSSDKNLLCNICNQVVLPTGNPFADNGAYNRWPLSWLKRIPPLSELESSKTDEPMKEPA